LFEGRRVFTVLQESGLEGERSGWQLIETDYKSFDDALFSVLNYGGAAMVVKPKPLRLSVADYGEQIVKAYKNRPPKSE
jgi:hypothetical protein